MGRLATWLAIVTVAFILLACAPPPELGDLRYIEAQRNCLTINMYDAGVDVFRSESAPPTEEEMQTAKEQCGEMGYQWVYTKRAFAEHITILGSRTADPSATLRPAPTVIPTFTPTPQIAVTPIAMTFKELAQIYGDIGPDKIIGMFEGKLVEIEAVPTGIYGSGGHTGMEFTTFRMALSADGTKSRTYPVNPQTGNIMRLAKLYEVSCKQNILNQRDFGLFKLQDRKPPSNSTVIIEGTFYFANYPLPTIQPCKIISVVTDAAPAP